MFGPPKLVSLKMFSNIKLNTAKYNKGAYCELCIQKMCVMILFQPVSPESTEFPVLTMAQPWTVSLCSLHCVGHNAHYTLTKHCHNVHTTVTKNGHTIPAGE